MKVQYKSTNEYFVYIYNSILRVAPLIGSMAAVTFTVSRLLGRFSFVPVSHLICFDVCCLTYFVAAYIFRKADIEKDGIINQEVVEKVELMLSCLIVFQWNLITYIFPASALWGFAPMFVLLSAFMYHTKAVRNTIIGISLSIALSWIIGDEELLPARDAEFIDNLALRITALIISFGVIYLLTFFAGKFTELVQTNLDEIAAKNHELESMGRDVIDFTADIIEERDSTSGLHVKRMKSYTRILAEEIAKNYPEYSLTEEKIELISMACVLHDVGKIGIPDSILQKPGKLTAEEFEVIKTHTAIGARVIDKLPDSVGEDYKKYCREICLFHHEKYDGKGYPVGLVGDEIPISAQIVSMVDCFDALTNERSYKPALPAELAINMILDGECGVFSDKMKQCLISCKSRFIEL